MLYKVPLAGLFAVVLCLACTAAVTAPDPCARRSGPCKGIRADDADPTRAIQGALLDAAKSTVALGAGRYRITAELSVAVDGVQIVGAGGDKTILDFSGSHGENGIKALNVSGFTVRDLAVENTPGDAIVAEDSRDVVFRDVRVEWTRGPNAKNGRYGLYPVRCSGVVVDHTLVRGASDAGIYVGESDDVIVRNNNAYENVSGIQIENTNRSDVYGNISTNNTLGLFVFDLPDKVSHFNGGHHRVHDNVVADNNGENFADPGAIAGAIPRGTGLMVMATRDVDVYGNTVKNQKTLSIGVVSYFVAQQKVTDARYFPYPLTVYIHDNTISSGGNEPKIALDQARPEAGVLLATFFGTGPVPDILYDGITTAPVKDLPPEIDPVTNPMYICFQGNAANGAAAKWADIHGNKFIDGRGNLHFDQFGPDLVAVNPPQLACKGPSQAAVKLPALTGD